MSTQKNPVILIVDDDEMNLSMAKAILETKIQAEYLTAMSGRECLSILEQRKGLIDLVLLDIAMPGMDGMETLSRIRQNPRLQALPVIFLTAAADKNTIIKASQLKINDYVKKPFMPDDLVSRVEKHLKPQFDDPALNDIFGALDKLGL